MPFSRAQTMLLHVNKVKVTLVFKVSKRSPQHDGEFVKTEEVTSASTTNSDHILPTPATSNIDIQMENVLPVMEEQLQIVNTHNPVPESDFLRFPFINQEFYNDVDTSEFLKNYLGEDTSITHADFHTSHGSRHRGHHTQKEGSVINFFTRI